MALVIDGGGIITWRDDRAKRMLGDEVRLRALATDGTGVKVDRLVETACRESVDRFEVSLVTNGKPASFAFRSEPKPGGGARMVGLCLDDEEKRTFGEVAATMSELAEVHRQLAKERRELADSNRALEAMHAEIHDKNAELRHASDVKSRVVSNVSHEFRTPINSILGITQLLLDRLDGELTEEQEKQLHFVRSSAQSLSDLVNDLLDLSRIEAGRHDLRVAALSAADLVSSLRGMMKPISSTA